MGAVAAQRMKAGIPSENFAEGMGETCDKIGAFAGVSEGNKTFHTLLRHHYPLERAEIRVSPTIRIEDLFQYGGSVYHLVNFESQVTQCRLEFIGPTRDSGGIKLWRPSSELRSGLDFWLVLEPRLARPQYLAHRVARHLQAPRDLLDRLTPDKVFGPYPRNRLHDQHPLTTRFELKREACSGYTSGVILDADPLLWGVKIASRLTA
jgi:hypothetical protein